MADFEHKICFNIEDVIHAQEEYRKLLDMAKIKCEHVRHIVIAPPMDKLVNDIHKASMTEALHIRNALDALERTLDVFLEQADDGSA